MLDRVHAARALVCCLWLLGVPAAYAAGHHHHGEAGQLPLAGAPTSGYVDSDPPLWDNLGSLTYPVSIANPKAQGYFDQGLRLAYAFNHLEAQRAFRKAQKLDPRCALCYWGEALVLGPNINAPMEGQAVAPAWKAVAKAKSLAGRASERERGLIDALAKRYAKAPKADRKALNIAYAEAMGRLAGRYPQDDQIAVLYAESLMDLSPWSYWDEGGHKPKGHTAEILQLLEGVLARNPDHPGAIHYYIHMVESSDRPERAEPYAEKLAGLMPGAGHLVHMPGHLYYRLGRYRDALEANRAAIAVDEAYLKETGAQGIYAQGYYPHNVHFLLSSAQMAGDGETALDAAGKLAGVISDQAVRQVPWLQPVKAAPYFAQAQFGAADQVRKLADPGAEFPYVRAMWHYARGAAAAAAGAEQDARLETEALERIIASGGLSALSKAGVPAADVAQIALQVLKARLAQAQGNTPEAIAALEAAVALQDKLPYMEPPYWYYPVRRSLGALRFLAGDLIASERDFRASLERAPNDAWALWGLVEVQRKRGDVGGAKTTEIRLARTGAGGRTPPAMERL